LDMLQISPANLIKTGKVTPKRFIGNWISDSQKAKEGALFCKKGDLDAEDESRPVSALLEI
jgi:hypothetical protein